MAGEYGYAPRVVTDQVVKPTTDFHGGMTVVCKCKDALRVFPSHAHQVGNAVNQYARLSRARTGKHKHVRLLPVVGHDAPLFRIVQILHDFLPGLRCRLTADFPVPSGKPALQEFTLRQFEIVRPELPCLPDVFKSPFGELLHDMNLQHLTLVVQRQRLEFGA